jgi:hypothetical protein
VDSSNGGIKAKLYRDFCTPSIPQGLAGAAHSVQTTFYHFARSRLSSVSDHRCERGKDQQMLGTLPAGLFFIHIFYCYHFICLFIHFFCFIINISAFRTGCPAISV